MQTDRYKFEGGPFDGQYKPVEVYHPDDPPRTFAFALSPPPPLPTVGPMATDITIKVDVAAYRRERRAKGANRWWVYVYDETAA